MLEKRDEILESVAKVFMNYGIKSVSMDDLARELGISKKTIYQFFKDKNDLIESVLKQRLSEDKQSCLHIKEEAINAIDSLLKVMTMVAQNTSHIHPSVFYDLQKYHPNAHKMIEDHQKTFVLDMIITNIERGRSEGV